MTLQYNFQTKTLIEEKRITQTALDQLRRTQFVNRVQLPDEFFALFLLAHNNEPERAARRLCKYFELRKNAPELFAGRNINNEDMQNALRTMWCSSIPVPSTNTKIHFMKIRDCHSKMDYVGVLKLGLVLEELAQNRNPPSEIITLIDMKGLTLKHLTSVKIEPTKKFFQYIQDGFSIKLAAIHFVNCNYVFQKFFSIVKLFISSELRRVINIHTSDVGLHRFYSAAFLPKEYGGDLPSVEEFVHSTDEALRQMSQFLDLQEQIIANNV